MATEGLQRISIGFQSGQVLTARVDPKDLKALRTALEDGGWHELRAEDGTVALNLGQVVYLNVDSDEHRVGFGA